MHASPLRIGDWISTVFARSLGPHLRPAGGSAKSSLTNSVVGQREAVCLSLVSGPGVAFARPILKD
jgi:hypothetical protein